GEASAATGEKEEGMTEKGVEREKGEASVATGEEEEGMTV
uniref:PTMA n=1 Tax=Globodera pallida TaxID=36090 RepID=A0A183CGH5_GLOPA